MALLTGSFNEAIDRKLALIEEDIFKMKEEHEYRDDRMEKMERKIDEYEQWGRENNIIITGLKNSEVDMEEICKTLNNKLETRINADIKYI